MINVRVNSAGLERLHQKVTRRTNFLTTSGVRDILRDAGDDLVLIYQKNIEGFTPGRVPDLKESTKKQKMKQVGSIYPILKRFGEFIRSMGVRVSAPSGGKGWTIRITYAGMNKGITNERLAEIHTQGEGNIPTRNFAVPPQRWKNAIVTRIRRELRAL